jgi:two-component system invasion response regulator UvrY
MTDKATIRVFIADDHAIVREGLKQILAEQRDISRRRRGRNGLDAIKLFRKSRCHVMLLDISMPDRNGIEVLKQIKKEQAGAGRADAVDAPRGPVRDPLAEGRRGRLPDQAERAARAGHRDPPGGRRPEIRQRPLAQALASQVGEDHDSARRTTACPTANTRP